MVTQIVWESGQISGELGLRRWQGLPMEYLGSHGKCGLVSESEIKVREMCLWVIWTEIIEDCDIFQEKWSLRGQSQCLSPQELPSSFRKGIPAQARGGRASQTPGIQNVLPEEPNSALELQGNRVSRWEDNPDRQGMCAGQAETVETRWGRSENLVHRWGQLEDGKEANKYIQLYGQKTQGGWVKKARDETSRD